MSKTSNAVKYRYNSKAYDYVQFLVRSGMKEKIKAHAEANGETLSGYINRLISADMGLETFAPGETHAQRKNG